MMKLFGIDVSLYGEKAHIPEPKVKVKPVRKVKSVGRFATDKSIHVEKTSVIKPKVHVKSPVKESREELHVEREYGGMDFEKGSE